jgi:magnesium chelatase subunit D
VTARADLDAARWPHSAMAAALFAVDPCATGGVWLRAQHGAVRDAWLALLRKLLPPAAPVRRVPLHIGDARLLGGLDLAATLRAGTPVAERGVLAASDGGIVELAMAERLPAMTAAHIAAALDAREVLLERDGFAQRAAARFGVVALDEGVADDEAPCASLTDRLAFAVDLAGIRVADTLLSLHTAESVAAARALLPQVDAEGAIIEALCATALALGIASIRMPLLALQVARAAAALDGRDRVGTADAELAALLVLSPRATRRPAEPAPPDEEEESADSRDAPDTHSPDDPGESAETQRGGDREAKSEGPDSQAQQLNDAVLEAAQAAIPAGLLGGAGRAGATRRRSRVAGRSGALLRSGLRGRPAGVQRGDPRSGARVNVIETLRAAAPWQRARRGDTRVGDNDSILAIRPEDFRVTRYAQRRETTTIFVVDASGSAALHRLAEAKGAVELLLAECYVRRDRVALIAFRGQGAELILPPTRSLVRAKRELASLAGGGGTPLAAGFDAARLLVDSVHRRGGTPTVVVLTDGRANIARDGGGGRARAADDAVAAARSLRAADVATVLIDTSPRTEPQARRIAAELHARYLALPYANAATLSRAVRAGAPVA